MPATLVESNVLLDVVTDDAEWVEWSAAMLAAVRADRRCGISTLARTRPSRA